MYKIIIEFSTYEKSFDVNEDFIKDFCFSFKKGHIFHACGNLIINFNNINCVRLEDGNGKEISFKKYF